jgi:hypothetical protein
VPDTFGDVWRGVRLRCPLAGPLLAQQWVRDAYHALCRKHPWSFLRGEAEIQTQLAHSGTVGVTRGSTSVVGLTLTFVANDATRQFRVTGTPIYTLVSVDPVLNTAVIDRPYGGSTASSTQAAVFDAYVTMPADFQRFLTVADPTNAWRLRWWATEEELNVWDPQRTNTGQPCVLASRRLASTATQEGRVQYELWPYQLSERTFPYYYIRHPAPLTDDSVFAGPLRSGGDVLLQGALAEAAEWPGTEDRKNPYFNVSLAKRKRDEYNVRVAELELRDEEIFLTWWETVSWINWPAAPLDAKWHQSHESSFSGIAW